jgi:hypothetical protein
VHSTHRKPLSLHPGRGVATLPTVHWMFTGLLIGASGATAVYTLWLVRRLFTTAPSPTPPPAADEAEVRQ